MANPQTDDLYCGVIEQAVASKDLLERHQAADQSYLEEGARLLEPARNAQRLFEK